jgi:hypothetical protein
MKKHLTLAAVFALAGALAACNLFDGKKNDSGGSTPTSPSGPTASMDTFAGTWSSTTATTPPTGCGNLKYTVTPVTATSANVTFNATCASNIQVNGTGTGTITGATLNWTAQGLVSQGNVNCPFSFPSGKAAESGTPGVVTVTYSGTVCGIPVSGTENVKR